MKKSKEVTQVIKEYGGYMPLELYDKGEIFDRYDDAKVLRFNCGRNAIAAALLSIKPKRIYIPYYNCNVVRDTLSLHGIPFSQYLLNENFEPSIDEIGSEEWILIVNYFGLFSDEKILKLAQNYKRVIFDNTQALFSAPILDDNCINVYSPRKFVGLSDGAYLVWNGCIDISDDYPVDVSWERASFLFKSIEFGTNSAYQDNLKSKEHFGDRILKMSVLTEKMLRSVDYEYIRKTRNRNYLQLRKSLEGVNRLPLPETGNAPFIYPLYVEDDALRKKIVNRKIYAPQWWKYLLGELPRNSFDEKLCKWLLPLPVDQRYSEQDMDDIAKIVYSCIGE